MKFGHYSLGIDERGETVGLTKAELSRRLGTRMAAETVLQYAVAKMGWIAIAETDVTVELFYDRATVSHLALIGAIEFIWRTTRHIIICESDGPKPSALPSADAISRLSALIDQRKPGSRFWRSTVPAERSPFARLMPTAMEIIYSDIEIGTQHRLLDSLLDHRYSINRLDTDNGHYKSLRISDGIAGFDRAFADNKLGDTYHAFVDPEFGSWLADSMAEMSLERAAKVEEVSATFRSGPRLGKVSYTRLLMPFDRFGDKFLLVASDMPE